MARIRGWIDGPSSLAVTESVPPSEGHRRSLDRRPRSRAGSPGRVQQVMAIVIAESLAPLANPVAAARRPLPAIATISALSVAVIQESPPRVSLASCT